MTASTPMPRPMTPMTPITPMPIDRSMADRPVAISHTLPVVGAIVRRSLTRLRRMPSAFIPSLAMPVFQLIAFGGAFAGALLFAFKGQVSSFDWYVPMASIQGAAFGSMGLAFATVNDLQTGFFDRLRLAPAGRNEIGRAHV